MNRKERRAANKRTPAGGAPLAAVFEQAIQLHQAGQIGEAEALCRTVASRDPRHVGSLHLLAVIAHQHGRFEEAAAQFRKVIALRPEIAVVHQGLGSALVAAGRLEEGATSFERALALKAGGPAGPDEATGHLSLGNLYNQLGRLADAERHYRRALAIRPGHAETYNNLGAVLVGQGRHDEGSAAFAQAIELAPELFESFSSVAMAMRRAAPVFDEAVRRAVAAWPRRLAAGELFPADSISVLANNPMLRCVLQSATVRDLDFEKFLTTARAAILGLVSAEASESGDAAMRFAAMLARQCFINEYVFLDTPEEMSKVDAVMRAVVEALDTGGAIGSLHLAILASYRALDALPAAQRLLDRSWPAPICDLLTQQIAEVRAEQSLRDTIPRLTEIADGASVRVRQQYEENPYPRWVLSPSQRPPTSVNDELRARFPQASFQPFGDRGAVDILVAGCGTGEHPIGMARRFRGARVLAVDLSLSSLAYAARKTRELGLSNIEYAHADILRAGSLGRTFDVIDASGVLHHLAEPMVGWRELLALLRPSGLMRVGLYSEHARADIVAARRFIAERGFQPSGEDIRRCRHELLAASFGALARYRDFFSASECRDLLFHVEEQQLTLPAIKEFLASQGMRFVGFEKDAATLQTYQQRFPQDPAMVNLDLWNAFELERPDTFRAMYQFWCQRF